MEKNLRVRVVHRLVNLPPFTDAPVRVAVNCWKLQMIFTVGLPPVIDGVNYEFLTNFSPALLITAPVTIVQGGVYDRDGLPVYLNQVFAMKSSRVTTSGLLLIEEYLDHDARQNR
jgi:hypothetical protein